MSFKFGNMTLQPQVANRLGMAGALSPLRSGFQLMEKGHTDKNFLTHEYAMVYVLSGKGFYEDHVYGKIPVQPGCFIQRFPGVLHETSLDGIRACFYLAVPGETCELFKVSDALASEFPVLEVGLTASIVSEYLSIIDEIKNKKEEDLMAVIINAQKSLLKFHQIARRQIKPENEFMDKAAGILSTGLSRKIKLPDVAAELKMSYPSFRVKFLEYMKLPPGEYRIKKRLEKAQELLQGGLNVKETAYQLGYPDAYSFSRQFKQVTGISPGKYINLPF